MPHLPWRRPLTRLGIIAPILLILSLEIARGAGRDVRVRFSAYVPDQTVQQNSLRVSADGSPARILSATSLPQNRQLLIIVDPDSYGDADLHRRVVLLGKALATSTPGTWTIRLGIPILDGILSPPLEDPRKMASTLDEAVTTYLADQGRENPDTAGRILDLIPELVEKAEKDAGPVECLLLFRDRRIAGEGADYLNAGLQRRLAGSAPRAGSTLYGWLSDDGILRSACIESAGLVWTAETPPGQVLREIAEARNRRVVLEIEIPRPAPSRELRFSVDGSTAGGRMVVLRAPRGIWLHVDGSEPPDLHRMQEGLNWIRRAREARTDGNATLARQFAETAVKSDSWNPEGYYLASASASDLGDLAAAEEWAHRAIAAIGPDERTLLVLGSVCRRMGKPAAALQRLRAFAKSGSPMTTPLLLELARLQACSGQYEAARKVYMEVLATGSRDASLHADFGETLSHLGDEREAQRQLHLALEDNPTDVKALILLAQYAAAAGTTGEALELARRAVDGNPRDADAHAGLAAVEVQLKRWEQAAESLQMALILSPDRQDLKRRYADVLCRAGRQREATAYLQKSIESNPEDAAAYPALAEVLDAIGEIGQAASIFEIGATRSASEAHDLFRRAAVLRERRGEYGQALLDYRAMLQVMPKDESSRLKSEVSSHLAALSILVDNRSPLQPQSLEKERAVTPSLTSLDRKRDNGIQAAAEDVGTISIPGGLPLLARSIGFGAAEARQPDLLEQIFSFILDAGRQWANRPKDNPILRDAQSTLSCYAALVRYMRRKSLLSADFNFQRPQDVVFPLFGTPEEIRRTRSLLSFFGIRLQIKHPRNGAVGIELGFSSSGSAKARRELLGQMGINLTDRRLREIRLKVGDEEVPMLFKPEVWITQILPPEGKKPAGLLERFLLDPRAMRLYVSLAGCAASTRNGLVQAFGPGELLGLVETLWIYGRELDFENGRLVFPGVQQSWKAMLAGPDKNGPAPVSALVRKDDWRALRIYASLAHAPRSVQGYLTATPERLRDLQQVFNTGSRRRGTVGFGFRPPDLSRILGIMRADEHGLLLPIDERLGRVVLSAIPAQSIPAGNTPQAFRVRMEDLGKFLEWGDGPNSKPAFSTLETIELLVYLQATCPDSLDQEVARVLTRDPVAAPAMLDLVIDLAPPAALLRQYLALAQELGTAGSGGWNVNRVRTSESLLALISMLHRQGALTRDEGLKLLGTALERFHTSGEPAFAWAVADFLSKDLLAMLGRIHPGAAPDRLLLEALAGPHLVRDFAFEGKWLQLDVATYKRQRMEATILQQHYTSLSRLLDAFQIIGAPTPEGGKNRSLESLKAAVGKIQTVDSSKMVPPMSRGGGNYFDAGPLMNKLTVLSAGQGQANLPQLVAEVVSALHTELGVTLLTYCYAYHGAPESDTMAFDPDFVRKHDFFGGKPNRGGVWAPASLEQKRGIGSLCTGSISGLGFELSRLETAQWSQGLGDQEERSLVPTILAGMRAVRGAELSDRTQEFVALSVQLGRELLARASLEAPLRSWCEPFFNARLSPRRRDEVQVALESGRPRLAAAIMTPSELFLLGQEWLLQSSSVPGRSDGSVRDLSERNPGVQSPPMPRPSVIFSPVFSRLQAILPRQDSSSDWSAFRHELDQYGVILRQRLGLNQLSSAIVESYEQLEAGGDEEILYERICDLKIRMADLHYQLGIPAFLGEVENELALRDILPRDASISAGSWKHALAQIGRLRQENARGWLEELLARGVLALPDKDNEEKGAVTSP